MRRIRGMGAIGGGMGGGMGGSMRGLAICVVVVAGIALVTPNHAPTQTRVLGALALAATAAWLVTAGMSDAAREAGAAARTLRKTRRQIAPPGKPRYTPVDAACYGLRVPYDDGDLPRDTYGIDRQDSPNVLRRALRLGTRTGNRAAAVRLLAAMADFTTRHRFLMGPELWRQSSGGARAPGARGPGARAPGARGAPRAIQVRASHELTLMRDAQRIALDAVQELTMRVPGGDISRQYAAIGDRIHRDTFRRMSEVSLRWRSSMAVRMAAAAAGCDAAGSPEPYATGRESMLYQ